MRNILVACIWFGLLSLMIFINVRCGPSRAELEAKANAMADTNIAKTTYLGEVYDPRYNNIYLYLVVINEDTVLVSHAGSNGLSTTKISK